MLLKIQWLVSGKSAGQGSVSRCLQQSDSCLGDMISFISFKNPTSFAFHYFKLIGVPSTMFNLAASCIVLSF